MDEKQRVNSNPTPGMIKPLTFQLEQDFLFKYCDSLGIDILESLRLKVSPPNQFNDPFEFLPSVDFCIDEKDVKKMLSDPERLRAAWENAGLTIPFEDFSATMCKEIYRKVNLKHIAGTRTMLQDAALKSQGGLLDFLSETQALACYSETSDNLLMWSHYTKGHRGIVVEFDIRNSFFSGPRANLMPVSYRSERVRATYDIERFAFDEHGLTVVRTKNLAWSYEREWRQLFDLKDCVMVQNPAGTPSFYVSIPSESIASVTFGVRCRPETQKIVRDLKKQPYLEHLRLQRAVLHERDFRLSVVSADDE